MQNKIKTAFNSVTADEQLKEKTRQAVLLKAEKMQTAKSFNFRRYALAPIALVITFSLAYFLFSYNIQVSAISVDINPSIELGINQYSRIISTKAYNSDGEELLNSTDIKNLTYEEGINKLLECDKAKQYINNDNVVVITVDSQNNSDEMIESIELNISQNVDMYCNKSNDSTSEDAHANGLSFGKYNAYLELKEYEPEITTDEISKMTMKEIKNRILQYKDENSAENNACGGNCESGNTESTGCVQNEGENGGNICSENKYEQNKNPDSQGKHYGKADR